jgi:Lsr2
MAQRFQVLLVCDLHGDDTPGVETVSFALDGASYEIDLCESHGGRLREAFAPFVAAGRRSSRAGTRGARRRRSRRAPGAVDPAEVRAWARANNLAVSQRGRISGDLLERYAASKA